MNKTLIFLLLFTLIAVPCIYAQQPSTSTVPVNESTTVKSATPTVKKQTLPRIIGEVVAIDTATANMVTIKDKSGKSESVNIDTKTWFIKSDDPITLSEIFVGDIVSVRYRTKADKKVASSIYILK